MNLQHLRRFVKPNYLPTYLQRQHGTSLSDAEASEEPSLEYEADTLYFLISASSSLSVDEASALLSAAVPSSLPIRTITVPSLSPISAEQADQWSKQYWPTIYKRTNPYGPHPSIIAHAEDEIRDGAANYMALAKLTAEAAAKASIGQNVGTVVVDRTRSQGSRVVAVAGDARWQTAPTCTDSDGGNALGHAVMRVIGLIARKRQEEQKSTSRDLHESLGNHDPATFANKPLTEVERRIYEQGRLEPGGYLCLDLDIYLTHEPCIMCSMALLHSRFGRVIFCQRMPKTGGLTADAGTNGEERAVPSLGYGLFWRSELNWKLLAWQWIQNEAESLKMPAINFHA